MSDVEPPHDGTPLPPADKPPPRVGQGVRLNRDVDESWITSIRMREGHALTYRGGLTFKPGVGVFTATVEVEFELPLSWIRTKGETP